MNKENMSKYVQLHILTSYPASNLNRDDLGRPKTVVMGNKQRLRVSSQSNKRAWRTSDVFQQELGDALGTRTKSVGVYVHQALTRGVTFAEAMDQKTEGSLATLKDKDAREIARAIAGVFGANKKKASVKKDAEDDAKAKALREELETEQLAHLTPAEFAAVGQLVEECRVSGKTPEKDQLQLLRTENMVADIAMFGRMLAASKQNNIEAAAQVSHAMTVHSVEVEDDFFTAVDDLNRDSTGAGHMGVSEFGAGLFYLHVCVDRELLVQNLGDNEDLAERALKALAKACCMVSPTGKQNSFASRAYASYCLAEKGNAQPRTLSAAFLKPLDRAGSDVLGEAVKALTTLRDNYDKVYGLETPSVSFNVAEGIGSIGEICDFIAE